MRVLKSSRSCGIFFILLFCLSILSLINKFNSIILQFSLNHIKKKYENQIFLKKQTIDP